jgi:hypothetical protein
MNLPKQIHLVLDNDKYRISITNSNNYISGWHPGNSPEVNQTSLIPPELLPELIQSILENSNASNTNSST